MLEVLRRARAARPAGEQGVAGDQMLAEEEADAAGSVARSVDDPQLETADFDLIALVEDAVDVLGVGLAVVLVTEDGDVKARLERVDAGPVVAMAVGDDDLVHVEWLRGFNDLFAAFGGIDDDRVVRSRVGDHVDVI